MQSFLSNAFAVYQKGVERIQATLEEIDAEMNENLANPDRIDGKELEVYKSLLEDAQMQHVQLTKHFNEVMLEKESELRHWKQQAALAKGGDAEELKYSPVDSPDDVERIKAEREMLQQTLEQTEEQMRGILRNQNNREVVLKRYEDKIQELSDLRADLEKKLRSHGDLVEQLSLQRENNKNSTDAMDHLAEEYSALAADAEIRQQNDRKHIQELERQNEQLRTKVTSMEQTLGELADKATRTAATGDQSPSVAASEFQSLKARVIQLQFELDQKDLEAQSLKDQLQSQTAATTASDQVTEELTQLREQLRNKEADYARIAAQAEALQQEIETLRAASSSNTSEQAELVERLKQDKENAINELQAKMDAEIEKVKRGYEDRLAALSSGASDAGIAHEQQLASLRAELQAERDEAVAETKKQGEAALQQAIAEVEARHEQAIRDAEAAASSASASAVATAIQDATERHAKEMQAAADDKQNAIELTKQEAASKLSEALAESNREAAAALEAARHEHEQHKKQALDDAARAAEERNRQALAAAQEETEQRLSKQRAAFDQKVAKVEGEKEELSQRLQDVEAQQAKQMAKAVADAELRKEQEKQQALKEMEQAVAKRIAAAEAKVEEYKQFYTQESRLRKAIHNKLLELQGNIRVMCRVRPIVEVERRSGQDVDVTEFPSPEDIIIHRDELTKSRYEFDRAFTPASTQTEVFEQVQPLAVSCMDGFNVCIFAYGQTGSGKTFTMEGPPDNRGVSHRAIAELFNLQQQRESDWTYTFKFSMLEIYNETLRDLLGNQGEKLEIRQTPTGNSVPGLTEVDVFSAEQVLTLMETGQSNRAVGAHDMNEHSSRSHSILTIQTVGVNKHDESQSFGKLHLIDLAGSERVSKTDATGDRLKEAQNINRSLSALGDVINALCSRKSGHIPYRNSKLTYLLQDSLGGNSKVMMFVNISPAVYNLSETVCSLNFAARCRNVELGVAKRQTTPAEAVGARLSKTSSRLSVRSERSDPPSPTGSVTSVSSSISSISKVNAHRAGLARTRSVRMK